MEYKSQSVNFTLKTNKLVNKSAATNIYAYSSPSILQASISRPPFIIRPLDLVPKGNFLC